MIENVIHNEKLLSVIIKANYKSEGIEFFTPDDFSQHLAYMNRAKDYVIPPHVHNTGQRDVHFTQEVLVIKSGKVQVDYKPSQKCLSSITIQPDLTNER